jgi:hypothetical protein
MKLLWLLRILPPVRLCVQGRRQGEETKIVCPRNSTGARWISPRAKSGKGDKRKRLEAKSFERYENALLLSSIKSRS